MQEEPTVKDVILKQVAEWIEQLKLDDTGATFHLNAGSKIDPTIGLLSQVFIIRAERKMEKVDEPPTYLKQDENTEKTD